MIGKDMATAPVAVWDLPIRLFHWLIVALFAFLWWSAENGETEWHMRAGYAMVFALLFRLLWGVVGSSTARFASFVRGPASLRRYLADPGGWQAIGHSPLGALSVMAMLAMLAVQVALGLILIDEDGLIAGPLSPLVSFETSEAARELHRLMFNGLLALVALHLAAILYFRLRGKRLIRAMIAGLAELPPETEPMAPAPARRALACAALAAAATWWLIAGAPPLGG